MLPTEKASKIHIGHWDEPATMYLFEDLKPVDIGNTVPYHLYFTSDEEIKEGDWVCNPSDLSINPFQVNVDVKEFPLSNSTKKIIATTDESLTKRCIEETNVTDYPLPKISQQDIETIVKLYNEGNPITDVMVEYEIKKMFHYPESLKGVGKPQVKILQPKLSKEGNIIIHHGGLIDQIKAIKVNPKEGITDEIKKNIWEELFTFGEVVVKMDKENLKT